MKILLLGATGRTGIHVVDYALSEGHEVICLSRSSTRITKRDGLAIFEGDPSKSDDLKKAIAGCDAVISVLNISRNSDFPWSSLRTPKNYLSDVMKPLIPIAESENIQRIVVCSAWGVGDTKVDLPFWFRWIIDHSNIGIAYDDHEKQEELLAQSELNWTIVRPVGLTNSKRSQQIIESLNNEPKPSLLISRASVAKYMVHCLTRDDLNGKAITISKR